MKEFYSIEDVAYIFASEITIEREFSVLENVSDNYPKYVIAKSTRFWLLLYRDYNRISLTLQLLKLELLLQIQQYLS